MLVELPKCIFFPSLTNDGLRVAYAPNQPGVICYREAPDFASEHQVTLPGEGGGMVQPAVSSSDGKKMVLIRQQYPGNDNSGLLLWDWRKLAVEAVYPTLGRPERVALAADMKHLAALCMRIVDNKSEFWVQLQEIGPKPVEVKRWKVDFHQTRIGFTPDSSAFF